MSGAGTDRDGGAAPRTLLAVLFCYGLLWIWLAIDPVNRRDWLLENLLVLILLPCLLFTFGRFTFSMTSYWLMAAFLVLHAVGAHYTYAEVPVGFWLKDGLGLSRNPFDRLAHFAYGALWSYPIRELLIRLAGVRGLWASALSVCVVLAQSGFFEVLEAIVAVIVSPELGSIYLGTQGDEWDAQHDMGAALGGALLTMILVSCLSGARREYPDPDSH